MDNLYYNMVKTFHKTFRVPMPSEQKPMEYDVCAGEFVIQLGVIHEKMKTHLAITRGDKELILRATMILEEVIELLESREIEEQADALGDIVYLAIGGFTKIGVEPDPIMHSIHRRNMEKLWKNEDTGAYEPRFTEYGKIIKPPGWTGPEENIKQEIEWQNLMNLVTKFTGRNHVMGD